MHCYYKTEIISSRVITRGIAYAIKNVLRLYGTVTGKLTAFVGQFLQPTDTPQVIDALSIPTERV